MKLNFKKIASVLASTVMLTSTIGFAAAANYPAPFSTSGGAVVFGANGNYLDTVAAYAVAASVTGTTTTSTVSTSGETTPLFTGSSKINVNDTLAQVKSILTSSDLPTVLKKGIFSGNVEATYIQTIEFGSATNANSPRITFEKQPTSSDDPAYGVKLGTTSTNYAYNETATFNKAVNFTHTDSKNQEITLFGQKYTIGSGTTSTDLVLFKSATKLNFDSTGTTSAEATIDGKTYTLELITASSTTATIQVTNEAGVTGQNEITEGYSKKINGITIAVNTADSNNQKYTASVIAGADKVTLTNNAAITMGDEGTSLEGTHVTFDSGVTTNLTKLTISVFAQDSDKDAIKQGQSFVDPIFGTFKTDFTAGMNIPDNETSLREDIVIRNSGDDKMTVKFTNNRENLATIQYAKNWSSGIQLQGDDEGRNITVNEGATIYKNEFVMVGNEDQGYLLKLSTLTNSSAAGGSGDVVKFTDAFSASSIFESTITSEGSGSVTIGGKVYSVTYACTGTACDAGSVTLNYPDSTGTIKVIYPTMQTSKGAKIGFYEPLTLAMASTGGLKIPNGNGYTDITITYSHDGAVWNFTGTGQTTASINTTLGAASSGTLTVGQLTYNVTGSGTTNSSNIYLTNPEGGNILYPAVFLIEEKDDNAAYHGVIVTTELGQDSTDGIGVDEVRMTWGGDTQFNAITLAGNSNKYKDADLFGTIALTDATDSDQSWVSISYPDEQIFAQIYGAAEGAVISGGGSSGGTGLLVAVSDNEIDDVKDKNLIVIGGSCVNKAAAKILGSDIPLCGPDFTDKTQVGSTQYIIKTVASPYNADKIAVLVAGYEAADTQSAYKMLLEGANTDLDTSQVYPIVGTSTGA